METHIFINGCLFFTMKSFATTNMFLLAAMICRLPFSTSRGEFRARYSAVNSRQCPDMSLWMRNAQRYLTKVINKARTSCYSYTRF
jgi:hypothetical protein